MDETKNTIFTHAKMEYTAQLIDVLAPNFFDGIKSIYDESKTVHRTNNPNNTSILILFRLFLEKVPTWSNEVIETETNRIIDISNCDWLNDLITAVFISHTKILTAIGSNNSNIELIIPKTINFIHKCYINIAREIWKNPYLFDDYVTGSEYQRNMRTVELLIKDSIENTIRKALPVKEILKQQLDIYDNSNNERNKITNDDIRKMLLEEIKSLKNENIPTEEENQVDIDEHEKESTESKVAEELRERINNIDGKFKLDLLNENNDIDNPTPLEHEEITPPPSLTPEEVISPVKNTYFEPQDGYVSPDEEEIKNRCENLDINTIPDLSKQEEIYDNVDIFSEDKENNIGDKSLLESYLDDVNDIDHAEIIDTGIFKDKPNDSISEDNTNIKEVIHKVTESGKEDKNDKDDGLFKITKEDENIQEEPKEEPKEIISVNKNDDTETVDLFFEDVSQMLEKKGIDINKENDKYTLFDDAIIEEDGY